MKKKEEEEENEFRISFFFPCEEKIVFHSNPERLWLGWGRRRRRRRIHYLGTMVLTWGPEEEI